MGSSLFSRRWKAWFLGYFQERWMDPLRFLWRDPTCSKRVQGQRRELEAKLLRKQSLSKSMELETQISYILGQMNPKHEAIARQRLPFLQSPSERKWTWGSALCLFSVPTQSLWDAVASSTSKSIVSDETVSPCQMCCGPFPRQVSCCWQAVWDRYQQMPVTSTAGTRGHCRNANNAGFPKLRVETGTVILYLLRFYT